MKKYLNILMLAAAAILLFACEKNASKEPVPTKQFSIVKANLAVAPEGGTCTLEVDAKQAVTVTPERDWCTAAVSGKIVTVTATANTSNESRYCRLKLQAGSEVLYATVQQYGEVFSGFEAITEITSPVEGKTIEIPFRTNLNLQCNSEESWIHTSLNGNNLIVDVDKNEEPRTRVGSVTYSAGSYSGSFSITQYPGLIKPDFWVITEGTPTFDYPTFATTASLSAEEGDMYVLRMVPKSSVEGKIDDWIFDKLVVEIRNSIQAEIEAAPETAFKDYLTTGTAPVTLNDIQPGENYVIAVGFGENGFVSGRYQYKLVTVEDVRPVFYKWTGKWKVHRENSKSTADDIWTISVKEKDTKLLIKGIEGLSNSDGRYDVEATVDEDGHLILKTQNTLTYKDASYGDVTVLLSGQYDDTAAGKTYFVSKLDVTLLSATLSDDFNSATMEGAVASGSYHFKNIQFYGRYKKSGSSSWSTISWNAGTTDIAQTITRIVE